jgi:hypothetical protein
MPFRKGDPNINRKGSRPPKSWATMFREALKKGRYQAVVEKIVSAAEGGDIQAAKLILDKTLPDKVDISADVHHSSAIIGIVSTWIGRDAATLANASGLRLPAPPAIGGTDLLGPADEQNL